MKKQNIGIELEEKGLLPLPDYIRIKNRSRLSVHNGADWQGYKWNDVTVHDVVFYYHRDARNISSGMRSLGDIIGDWRPIDSMAHECLNIFKAINRNALKREAKKYEMTLKE